MPNHYSFVDLGFEIAFKNWGPTLAEPEQTMRDVITSLTDERRIVCLLAAILEKVSAVVNEQNYLHRTLKRLERKIAKRKPRRAKTKTTKKEPTP